ncbi:hypothetical protein ACERII_12625 [Evansella sp. AB-rgal1]|uniref:hypothetical protein n=1 Tax=Evansella sp. AB-rgal1 TaxID=3242696 RepID=UPI00359DC806
MTMNATFIAAVDEQNKRKVQVMLKDSMMIDPTLTSFKRMLAHAEKNIVNLYDAHNGEQFTESTWTEEYFNSQMAKLLLNFSKERIELLKKISKQIYQREIVAIEEKRTQSEDTIYISKQKIGVGLVVAGGATIVASTVGIVAAKPILVAAGVAAVVAGGACIVADKRG